MAAAGVAPAGAAGPPQADVICLLDSDEDQPQPQQQVGRPDTMREKGCRGSRRGCRGAPLPACRAANQPCLSPPACLQRSSSGRGAGPSRQAPAGTAGRQQQPQPQQRRASAAGAGGGGGDVIDLTSDSPPEGDGELQIVRSTVQRAQRGPMRGVKRPRPSPQQQQVAQLSPMKAMLVQAARAAAALPPPEPEPEGPKCGICMEVGRLRGCCCVGRQAGGRAGDRSTPCSAWVANATRCTLLPRYLSTPPPGRDADANTTAVSPRSAAHGRQRGAADGQRHLRWVGERG